MSESTARVAAALSDRYRVERELGAGGMATVYLARDVKHDRDVAIKVLRPDLAAALGAERFLAEVRITARLDHPHILTLIDSGNVDGTLFYVMPFVRGESLHARLTRERQLNLDEALTITRQTASGLDYTHRQAVIHRTRRRSWKIWRRRCCTQARRRWRWSLRGSGRARSDPLLPPSY